MITKIQKRDGRIVTFNIEKIANAIYKAAESMGGSDYDEALEIAGRVCDYIESSEKNTIRCPAAGNRHARR